MDGVACFMVDTGYMRTEYEPLKKLGISVWDAEHKVYHWFFHPSVADQVRAIMATPILLNAENVKSLWKMTGSNIEFADVPEFKGKGDPKVEEYQTFFRVIEYRKKFNKKTGEVESVEDKHDVPIECVSNLRQALEATNEKYPKWSSEQWGHLIPGRIIARRVCRQLGITRYDRPSGSFDKGKFYGERTDYFKYFYYPLKCLAYLGEVAHHASGDITKLQDYLRYDPKEGETYVEEEDEDDKSQG